MIYTVEGRLQNIKEAMHKICNEKRSGKTEGQEVRGDKAEALMCCFSVPPIGFSTFKNKGSTQKYS